MNIFDEVKAVNDEKINDKKNSDINIFEDIYYESKISEQSFVTNINGRENTLDENEHNIIT